MGSITFHYENLPMQYTENFSEAKIEYFMIFGEAVLTSNQNLCFGSRIRKIGSHVQNPVFFLYTCKIRMEYISGTCFPD